MAFDVGGVKASLGAEVDDRGFREFDAKMAAADRKTAKATIKADVDENSFRRATLLPPRLTKVFNELGSSMKEARLEGGLLRRFFDEMKLDALILGLGLATQGVNALGAGVVGLTAALAPLSGLLVAYPALLTTFGQAAGVVAVAGIGDLTEALGGNKDAFKRLTPEAKNFIDTIKGFQPQFDKLKESVQGPLFGGLEKGLSRAMDNFAPFRRVLSGTADAMGDLAARAGRFLGRDGFGRDFEKIGNQNTRILRSLGRSGLNFADALRHVLVAARPLENWLTKLIGRWSETAKQSAKAGRETGKLADFFERTRNALHRVLSIADNLAGAFSGIGEAARPLGNWILKNVEEITGHLDHWANSAKGQDSLSEYFENAKKPLAELGRLSEAIGEVWLHLSEGPEFTRFIRLLRTEFVPVFEELAEHILHVFSDPEIMHSFAEFIQLAGNLLGVTKPMELLVRAFGGLASVLNDLFGGSNLVHQATLNIIGMYAAIKTIGLLKGLSDLFGFGKGLTTITDKIPDALKSVTGFKRALNDVAGAAQIAKESAGQWVGNFVGGLKNGAGRVRDVLKSILTRAQTWTSSASEAVGTWVGSMVGRFGSSRLGQKLTPFFKKVALRLGAMMAAAVAGAVVIGEGVGGLAASLLGRIRAFGLLKKVGDFGKLMGRRVGVGLMLGLLLAFPYMAKQAWDLGKKLGEVIRNAITSQVKNFFEIGAGHPEGMTLDEAAAAASGGGGVQPDGPVTGPGTIVNPDLSGPAGPPPRPPGGGKGRHKRGMGPAITDEDGRETERNGRKLRDATKKAFEGARRDAEDQTKRQRVAVTDNSKRQRQAVEDDAQKTRDDVHDRLQRQNEDVDDSYTRQRDTAREKSGQMRDAIKGSVDSAAEATSSAMHKIFSVVNKAMKSLGLDPVTFGAETDDSGKGGKGGGGTAASGALMAGYSRTDNRTIRVRGGEAILRPEDQIPTVDAAMQIAFGVGLFDYMRAGGSKMGYAAGGTVGFAPGGMVGIPGFPGESIDRRILPDVQRLTKAYRLFITDGYSTDTVHAANGEHPLGLAIDAVPNANAGGSWDLIDRLAHWAEPVQNQPIDPFRWVGYDGDAGHGRGNHVHLSWQHGPGFPAEWVRTLSGQKIGGMPGVGGIKPIKITGPAGMVRDVAQAAADRGRRGANRFLARKSRVGIREIGGVTGVGSAAGVHSLATYAGFWNKVNPDLTKWANLMGRIVQAESGFDPHAGGPGSGNYNHAGWYQYDAPTWAGDRPKGAPGWPEGPYDPLIATQGAGNAVRGGGMAAVQQHWTNWDGVSPTFALGGLFNPSSVGVDYAPLIGLQGLAGYPARVVASLQAQLASLRAARHGYSWRGRRPSKGKIAAIEHKLAEAQRFNVPAWQTMIDALTVAPMRRASNQLFSGIGAVGSAVDSGATSGVSAALSRLAVPSGLNTPDYFSSYASSQISRIRRGLAINQAARSTFGGFAMGGVVGAGGGGGGPVIVSPPNVTVVAEGDLAAFNLRVKRVVVDHEQTTARTAGLSRMNPGGGGRARY